MSDTGITVVKLPASLDPTACDALLRDLRTARNTAVMVEAGEVSRVSTLALQVLLASWMTWKSDGHDFHIASATPALTEAAALLGLPADFRAPQGRPA